jgi:hypothetical protein
MSNLVWYGAVVRRDRGVCDGMVLQPRLQVGNELLIRTSRDALKDFRNESERVCDVGIFPEASCYLVVNADIDEGGRFMLRIPILFQVFEFVGMAQGCLQGQLVVDQPIELQNVGCLLAFEEIKRRTTVESDFCQDGVIELMTSCNGRDKRREGRWGRWPFKGWDLGDQDTVMDRIADVFELGDDISAKCAENEVANVAWEGFPRRHRGDGIGQQETGE